MTVAAFAPPTRENPSDRDASLRALAEGGAHFVVCRDDKRPVHDEWNTLRPSIDEVLHQGSLGVGLVPASVGLVVVDVDSDKDQPGAKSNDLVKRNVTRQVTVTKILGTALVTVPSKNGGHHLHYKGTGLEGNKKWPYGDIRGAKGYVILYDPIKTLKAVELANHNNVEVVDVSLLSQLQRTTTKKKKTKTSPRQTPEVLHGMVEGQGGGRNNYLNEGVFLDARDGQLTPEREAAWRDAALASGLSHSDVDATLRSASAAGEKAEVEFIRHPVNHQILARNQKNIRRALHQLMVDLWWNDFSNKPMISYGAFQNCVYEDEQRVRLLSDIEEKCGFIPPEAYFDRVMSDVMWRNKIHPVRQYLESLVWDQEPRSDDWLMAYAGVSPGESPSEAAYVRAVSRIFLMAAVGRIYQPGVKFDEMVVLESSEQGKGKSSLLRALCPDESWFSDDLPLNVDAKQIIERTAGKWLIEAAELSGMHASKVEHLKTMLSRGSDGPVRLAYGRLPVEKPRHFVLMGTTNAAAYLDDPTGNRRFWPVIVNTILLPEIRRDRDQLWAEAVVLWKDPQTGRTEKHSPGRDAVYRRRRRAGEKADHRPLGVNPRGGILGPLLPTRAPRGLEGVRYSLGPAGCARGQARLGHHATSRLQTDECQRPRGPAKGCEQWLGTGGTPTGSLVVM